MDPETPSRIYQWGWQNKTFKRAFFQHQSSSDGRHMHLYVNFSSAWHVDQDSFLFLFCDATFTTNFCAEASVSISSFSSVSFA